MNWSDPNTCSTTPFVPGVYGTMGVPDVSNIPGFGMELPSWTDNDGNFWLLGDAASDAAWVFNPSANPVLPELTITLAGLLVTFGKARRFRGWILVALAAISFSMLTGCSGGGGGGTGSGGKGGNPPPTTSTITITATAGSLQQTATILLTLN
jgi:hypothetical protein